MTIAAGTRLGPYEIVSSVGAGGMGEVWRARDTRLDREVAIKVLPAGFAASEQFVQRFDREARAISALNHPHICTLYDVGDACGPDAAEGEGSARYLVMELLEGESLADRLKKGALPLADVLKYGRQIASALDAAHRRGITHRDLKPGNVMLTRAGAKLLDFGLAKSAQGPVVVDGLSSMPTSAKPLTQEGTILGTFQYMAPEQLEGLETDPRTDIFALGALLYEMATGQRAFKGETKTSVIAAIVSSQPEPISSVMPMSPPALDHVVRRCLQKDPDDRWQSAHDVASELQWISEAGSQAGVGRAVTASRKARRSVLTALAVAGWLLALVAIAWALARSSNDEQVPRLLRAELIMPPQVTIGQVAAGVVALSPDESKVVVVAPLGSTGGLLVRDLPSGETRPLPGTDNASFPFWSPDGRWVGFFSGGKLKKIDVRRGTVQSLADAPQGRGGSWGSDGTITFAPEIKGPLLRVSESGGSPEPVTKAGSPEITHRNPHMLPGGGAVLYIERKSATERFGHIWVASIKGDAEPRMLVRDASNPQYARGYLFWVREGNLLAQPFDAKKMELSGAPEAVAEAVEYNNPRDIGNFSVAGSTIVWKRESSVPLQLVRVDLSGREVESFGEPGFYRIEDLSRDGSKLLLTREDEAGGHDIWVMDLSRRQMTRSTFTTSLGVITGRFSPDASKIAVTNFGGTQGWSGAQLWIQSATGSSQVERLAAATGFHVNGWSPDGKYLVGRSQDVKTSWDVQYLAVDEPDKPKALHSSPFDEMFPRLSPDGRWVSYSSNESGQREIYVSDFPEGRRKWQVSNGSVSFGFAEWSPTGKTLYYRENNRIMKVVLNPSSESLDPAAPERTEVTVTTTGGEGGRFVIDGESFLTLKPAGDIVAEPIRLIRGWRESLERAE